MKKILLAAMVLVSAQVHAARPTRAFYLGNWRVVSLQRAPWARPGAQPDLRDVRMLRGRTFVFSARAISAPRPVGCPHPHYQLKSYTADMLFQGSLTDPAKQARVLGYPASAIRTLETGCDGAIDFHFIDDHTALFGLNNYLYRLARVGP